jgi:hypothetical protein
MNCPICQATDLAPHTAICPHCGTDLLEVRPSDVLEERYYHLLRQRLELEGKHAAAHKQHIEAIEDAKQSNKRLWLLLLLLPVLSLICRKKPTPSVPLSEAVQKDSLIQVLRKERDSLESKTKILYVIKKGDKLVDLGKRFWGHPDSGYRIGRDNGIYDSIQYYHLIPGDTLVIRF